MEDTLKQSVTTDRENAKEIILMPDSEVPRLTRSEREAFWRTLGWSPEMPEDKRRVIEERWTDEAIDLARFHGF